MVGLEAHEREFGFWGRAQDLAAVFSLVGEADRDLSGALDAVEVRQDQSALVDDHAGAESGPPELGTRPGSLGPEELVEEVLEERIIVAAGRRARTAAGLGAFDGAEVNDRGAHLLGHADEALLERFRQRGTGRRGLGRLG